MKNGKETILHNPEEGVLVVIHTPTSMKFIIEGHDPMPYFRDCMILKEHPGFGTDNGWNEGCSLTVLEDFKLKTRYQFEEIVIRPECPGQVSKLIEYITKGTQLQKPDIIVSESFFNHIYGIKEEISIRDLEYGHYM